MNHIKALQEKERIYAKGIEELKRYLTLPKFDRPNDYVNVKDIFLRLDEMQSELNKIG